MSILKAITGTPKTFEQMVAYLRNPAKTSDEVIFAIGSNPQFAVKEMEAVQKYYPRTPVHPYKHYIFSFDKTDTPDPRLTLPFMREVTQEIAHKIVPPDYQGLCAIHYKGNDCLHPHVHIIFNRVSVSGNLYRQSVSMFSIRKDVDAVLQKYKLPPLKKRETKQKRSGQSARNDSSLKK
ncbi:relaxase/mobilization nuclease domain-containing protein [uncultured Dialister sp.]|uniref:relaxase/mobilization nuclease domain-containing protein n=1 Tax=uncultured Dialister sp. TaxID=278064 RepID=UPI0025D0FBF0|nr:relaxase/mobilization nuclease domain-containing protein [uncultured Dialister sp.]